MPMLAKLVKIKLIILLFYCLQVLEQHLACAALEHPLSLPYDEKYFGPGLSSVIVSLKDKGYLISDPSCDSSTKMWNYIGHEVYSFFSIMLILPVLFS